MLVLADDAALARNHHRRLEVRARRRPRVALLERFAATADPPRRRGIRWAKWPSRGNGLAGARNRAPRKRLRAARRSPAAEKEARHGARVRAGIGMFLVPLNAFLVDALVRRCFLIEPGQRVGDEVARREARVSAKAQSCSQPPAG
jgi:hypothetical protein